MQMRCSAWGLEGAGASAAAPAGAAAATGTAAWRLEGSHAAASCCSQEPMCRWGGWCRLGGLQRPGVTKQGLGAA